MSRLYLLSVLILCACSSEADSGGDTNGSPCDALAACNSASVHKFNIQYDDLGRQISWDFSTTCQDDGATYTGHVVVGYSGGQSQVVSRTVNGENCK